MRFGRVFGQSREHVSEPSLWTTFRTATYAPQKKALLDHLVGGRLTGKTENK
jgi:hypothetical protein